MTALPIVYPEGLRFTCSRCGDCCRGWNVMLGPGEVERLESLDWSSAAPDLVGATVAAAVPGDAGAGRLAIARREDGACIYLGSENQCRIHERFGEEAKPLLCRLYPFGFFRVGDRIGLDVSFACRAVSEDRGEPLSRRVSEWTRLFAEPPPARERHRFSAKYDVAPDVLWELEHHVLALLSDEGLTLLDRVRAVHEFNRLAATGDPGTEAARTLRLALAKGIPRQIRERPLDPGSETMDRTARLVFHSLLYLALNPTPSELFALPPKAREREAGFRAQAALGYRVPGAHPFLDNRESRVTYGAIAAVRAEGLSRGDEGARLGRYLEAKILGQRFLQEGDEELPFVEAVPRLLLLVPLTFWTAKALACERGAPAAEEDDLRRALRLLDRSYGEVRLSSLPPKTRKAWRHVLFETDLPVTASLEMLAYNAS